MNNETQSTFISVQALRSERDALTREAEVLDQKIKAVKRLITFYANQPASTTQSASNKKKVRSPRTVQCDLCSFKARNLQGLSTHKTRSHVPQENFVSLTETIETISKENQKNKDAEAAVFSRSF